jgi:hypothetical protein
MGIIRLHDVVVLSSWSCVSACMALNSLRSHDDESHDPRPEARFTDGVPEARSNADCKELCHLCVLGNPSNFRLGLGLESRNSRGAYKKPHYTYIQKISYLVWLERPVGVASCSP